jgi:hypothetical protein
MMRIIARRMSDADHPKMDQGSSGSAVALEITRHAAMRDPPRRFAELVEAARRQVSCRTQRGS